MVRVAPGHFYASISAKERGTIWSARMVMSWPDRHPWAAVAFAMPATIVDLGDRHPDAAVAFAGAGHDRRHSRGGRVPVRVHAAAGAGRRGFSRVSYLHGLEGRG